MNLENQINNIIKLDEYKSWLTFFQHEKTQDYFIRLNTYISERSKSVTIYPQQEDVFNAFKTPANKVRVIILGQDPYYGEGQAMGLAFSVRNGIQAPASLQNIFTELESDMNIKIKNTDLTPWAKQGIFLINTALTVEKDTPASHVRKDWKKFVEQAINYVFATEKDRPLVAILWGTSAERIFKKATKSGSRPVKIIKSYHPSPRSAYRGPADRKFFGSKPFSRTNALLSQNGEKEIDWQL